MTRFGFVMTTYTASLFAGASAIFHPAPALIWNASASVPVGLYSIASPEPLKVHDLVLVQPPEALAEFLRQRGYLPRGVPLLKRVAALSGQTVCRANLRVTIDAQRVAAALGSDRRGRPLPVWRGCRRIGEGEVFLLNPDRPDSLDGRYFGPLPRASVIGRANPIWTPRAR